MPLAIFCGCTARFVLDLVGNPEDRFSDVAAQLISQYEVFIDLLMGKLKIDINFDKCYCIYSYKIFTKRFLPAKQTLSRQSKRLILNGCHGNKDA